VNEETSPEPEQTPLLPRQSPGLEVGGGSPFLPDPLVGRDGGPIATVRRVTIPGEPIGKGRPRASVIGGHVRMRTPVKTARWEAFAAETIRLQWRPVEPERGPVCVSIVAVFSRPKSKTWKTKPMPRYPHVGRPDADNIIKAVCDALEKAGAVHNDSQVWSLRAEKWVAAGDEQPHVAVTLTCA